MKGIILAAGMGSRLKSLARGRPKALIPILGKPLIYYTIESLRRANVKKIAVVIRPQDKNKFKFFAEKFRLDLTFFFQERPQGTLKALGAAESFVYKESFLLSWCDTITPFNFSRIIRYHQRHPAVATLAITKEANPANSAQVIFRNDRIIKIIEKPKRFLSSFVSSTPLVLESEIFRYFRYIRPTVGGEYHLAGVLQYLIKKGKIVRFIILDTWRVNINTVSDLKQAQRLTLDF
jgi:glucose-1-phosphate thymidylyltransferase